MQFVGQRLNLRFSTFGVPRLRGSGPPKGGTPNRIKTLILLLAWLGAVAAGTSLCAQNNPSTTAPMRLRIEKIAGSDWPAKMGVVEVSPCLGSTGGFGVFSAEGKPLAFQTFWSAQGEASKIRFDCSSGGTTYYVCFGSDLPLASGGLKSEAGVFLETRPCRADLPIDTAPQITKLINTAGPPAGCDYVPNVFLGANPFGPSTYYIATFNGWFTVANAASYTFATASDDASFLEVDNRTVATWLGNHGAEGGTRGEHSGTVALSAGPHLLSYVQIQRDAASAAVAAWKPPGRDHIEVMPPSAFVPVARFEAARFERAAGGAERLYFDWRPVDHCALGGAVFARVQFRVFDNARPRDYRWHFDDGSEETGANPRHFFPQTGLRQVILEARQNGVVVATNSVRLRIDPVWQQNDWWRDDVFNQAKSDFLRRDPALMPSRDLIAILDLADRADDQELLMRFGESLVKRQEEFNAPAYAATFYKLGTVFEHQGDGGDAQAEKSFRLALAPERFAPTNSEQAKLHIAALLLHCDGELDEAAKALAAISGGLLNADEKKLWRLLQGDLLLARGKSEQARKQYAAAGEKQAGGGWNAARAARLESAAIMLEHSRWEDAQEALDRLQLERPLERMSLDTGLLALNLDLARQEYRRAFNDGQTLLTVAGEDPRQSEILYALVEAGLALGKQEAAQKALGHLLKDFPYSEAAAKAKDRWTKK
jgi:tetratricopeptide (TPR) repeat protein